jgi:hypothetical protein
MACGGCKNRQEALNRMMEAARQKDLQRVSRMGAYVVKSSVRDLRQVAQASWQKVARRPR